MKDESESVSADESVLRLIWFQFLRPGQPLSVLPVAFKPRADETDGISVFRSACLQDPTDALSVMAPEKRTKYAIATLPVAELLTLGLSVRPAKIETVPGHAIVPELTATRLEVEPAYCKALQIKLAQLAARNLLPPKADPTT